MKMKRKGMLLILAALSLVACDQEQGSKVESKGEGTTDTSTIGDSSKGDSSVETPADDDDDDYGGSEEKDPVTEEPTANPNDKTRSEMMAFLEGTLLKETTTQSKFSYNFTRSNVPYNEGTIFDTAESFTENILLNGVAVSEGVKKSKKTTAEGKITEDLSVNYLKKFDADDTYYYQVKDYDSDTTKYGFTDEAKRLEKITLAGADLYRAQGDFISAYAIDLIDYLFSPYSTSLSSLPSFKESEDGDKKTYTAKASVSNSGADSAGSYKESYYYEMKLTFDGEDKLTGITGKKSWQYRLDDSTSTTPDKYQYDDYSYQAEYGERAATVSKDLNVKDYFITDFTGIKLRTFKNAKYEDIDPTSAERGIYISSASATGYAPSKAADTHLIPVSSSNESVIRLDKTCNNFFIERVYGTATLTFKSVTGVTKTIEVTTKEGKEAPYNLNLDPVSRSKFLRNSQDYGSERFMYIGREYAGLKIKVLDNKKYDDQIDTVSSNEEVATIQETSSNVGSSFTSRIYSVTPKKEGKVTLSWYAALNHDVKREFTFTVKKGLTAEELKQTLINSTWTFTDQAEAQTLELSFTDKKATMKNILANETIVATSSYSLEDYKITFDGWYDGDGEQALGYGKGEMSIAGDNIRFFDTEGSAITGDLFTKRA